ncbi:hypothetical protein [Denitromonas sp.]|uniref:hypothetical protein n=1 Tax=Denitromonas sp. TaxID=2734609 RepID=UPI002AFE777C|nr:hypothetical protein [Denitromonas sp.]
MTWDSADGRLCKLLHERQTGCMADNSSLEEFQEFVAAVRLFEQHGILTIQTTHISCRSLSREIEAVFWSPTTSIAEGLSHVQVKALVLRYLASFEREYPGKLASPTPEHFSRIAGDQSRIDRVCRLLHKDGFIEWDEYLGEGGSARILDEGFAALSRGPSALNGSEKVRGTTVHINNSNNINGGTFNTTGDVVIGSNPTLNKQALADELEKLILALKKADAPESEKTDALQQLKDALKHPLVTTIVGGMLGGLFG